MLVNRKGAKDFDKGVYSIVVDKLTSHLIPNSSKAEIVGTNAKIISFEVEEYYEEVNKEDLSNKIEILEQKKDYQTILEDSLTILNKSDFYLSLVLNENSKRLNNTEVDFDIELCIENMDQIMSELQKIRISIKDTKEKIDNLNSEIDLLKKHIESNSINIEKDDKKYYKMYITFEVFKQAEINFAVNYFVPLAFWNTVYDFYVSSDEKSMNISMNFNIMQTTDEDWKDVIVKISGNDPNLNLSIPELNPWYIDVKQDKIYKETKELFNAEFVLEGRYTIPSNADTYKFEYSVDHFDISCDRFAIPRKYQFAYIKAELKNETDKTYPKGLANIYFNNTYVNGITFEKLLPNQDVEISLGIDSNILVEFEDIKKEKTGKNEYELSYQVKLENYNNDMKKIKILETAPISENNSVEVEIIESNPEIEIQSDEDIKLGKITWILEIKPEEKKSLDVKYKIKAPFNYKIKFN